ncbi:MAG: hypothetical protein EZS28_050095, partial [Streblomastix strix]
ITCNIQESQQFRTQIPQPLHINVNVFVAQANVTVLVNQIYKKIEDQYRIRDYDLAGSQTDEQNSQREGINGLADVDQQDQTPHSEADDQNLQENVPMHVCGNFKIQCKQSRQLETEEKLI